MSRGSSAVKVQQWVERFRRFLESGKTVATFCQAEGISVPSFYNWKKKLGGNGVADNPNGSLRRTGPASQANSPRRIGAERKAFQAIELIPTTHANVTIRLPNGIVIELDGDSRATERLFERALQSPVDSARGWSC